MKDNFCEICYEPINEAKIVCGMCADNRVKDEIWTEEEKNKMNYDTDYDCNYCEDSNCTNGECVEPIND